MAKQVKELVKEYLEEKIANLDVELVEVEYAKKVNGMNLTLFIDSPNGIDLNKCEEVHKMVDVELDVLDPTNGAPYTLNVSSIGLDYAFRSDRDFERNIGAEVEANLYTKVNGKKSFVGKLVSFTSEGVVLEVNSKEVTLVRKNISKITKYISI